MAQAFDRRTLLRCACTFGATLAGASPAQAALFRALSLESLVRASETVSAVTALAAECHYEAIGSARRIVTDTRVRLERSLGGRSEAESEFVIRTLGGIVGERGELVDGQATLALAQRAVVFLGRSAPALYFVVGMAQGHFPLIAGRGGVERLGLSPRLPRLLRSGEVPAAERLIHKTLEQARGIVRSARG